MSSLQNWFSVTEDTDAALLQASEAKLKDKLVVSLYHSAASNEQLWLALHMQQTAWLLRPYAL